MLYIYFLLIVYCTPGITLWICGVYGNENWGNKGISRVNICSFDTW
jgi:hypothetical protein